MPPGKRHGLAHREGAKAFDILQKVLHDSDVAVRLTPVNNVKNNITSSDG